MRAFDEANQTSIRPNNANANPKLLAHAHTLAHGPQLPPIVKSKANKLAHMLALEYERLIRFELLAELQKAKTKGAGLGDMLAILESKQTGSA